MTQRETKDGSVSKHKETTLSNGRSDVLVVDPGDVRAWEVVCQVREMFRSREIRTIVAACKEAGIDRNAYYRALRRPYVQQMVAQENLSQHYLTLTALERHWVPVLVSQIDIATDPGNRNAVAAARFLVEERDKAIEALGVEDEVQDKRLDDLMKTFASMPDARKRVKVTKKSGDTTVAMEIEE